MRIGFVGCGAIGSCYASYLLQKHEVCVLDTYEPVNPKMFICIFLPSITKGKT